MKILVLNCGSSSIKYQFINTAENDDLLAKGLLERIGIEDSELKHKPKGKDSYKLIQNIPDHQEGINLIIKTLMHPEYGVIKDKSEINAVGHRVAHGGENFKESVLIDEAVKRDIEQCIELAPLHNPANLKGIQSIEKILPEVPQVAVFDTSFHQTMPTHAYLYGIPYKYYEMYKIRRYGFHGTSHKFVAKKACEILSMDFYSSKIITCHLGNGASVAAIKNGESIDTSMGFTPIEGLIMGTRVGDLDLGVLFFLMEKENLTPQEANKMMNKESGMLGVSGISYDMRDIENAKAKGDERATVALDMYNYKVKKYIGAYAAAMNGVDIIVLTGGIGENADTTREGVCSGLEYLGVQFDPGKNKGVREKDILISKENSKVKVMAVTTNEELVIARDTKAIVSNK